MLTGPQHWTRYILPDFDYTHFAAEARVLDLGCGSGRFLHELAGNGCRPIGVDPFAVPVKGRIVVKARAEALPFKDGAFDGVLSRVSLCYTDEAKALAEVSRVTHAQSDIRLCTHGIGYYCRYLLRGSLMEKIYAARTIVNTALYRLTGRRLVGDTLFQGVRRLHHMYRRQRLIIDHEQTTARVPFWPVFIYQRLHKA